ncbi:uncharacterized protein K02A2.6-like [Ochlerotatus camptorhynchus]|uniref:uncharacterized protein K02A2.6-like n=1 Tax=Ochlerotatus camptorhynchus TaxID=644619 RepID=UPI0031CFAB3C
MATHDKLRTFNTKLNEVIGRQMRAPGLLSVQGGGGARYTIETGRYCVANFKVNTDPGSRIEEMACKKRYILTADSTETDGSNIELACFEEVRSDETGTETHSDGNKPDEDDASGSSSADEDVDSDQSSTNDESEDEAPKRDSSNHESRPTSESDCHAPDLRGNKKPNSPTQENTEGHRKVNTVASTSSAAKDDDRDRMDRMERALIGLTTLVTRMESSIQPSSPRQPETTWNFPRPSTSTGATPLTIRWDNIKPFPSGVPANRLWEEWNRYINTFEIAATLSNANDPATRTNLLYLSMGPDLQEIVSAGKLCPANLDDVNCFKAFVENKTNYFRGMTDMAAENEAFIRMTQGKDETAVAFHARLMCKARLCSFKLDEQERMVQAQLLRGLRNKEIVKMARRYGHAPNIIVQAATRDEAYEAETVPPAEENVFQVSDRNAPNHGRNRKPDRKRKSLKERDDEPSMKRRQQDQDQRCEKCNLTYHRKGVCPALRKNCNYCRKRGHFEAACQNKRVRAVRFKREDPENDLSEDDEMEDRKCVNALSLENTLISCSLESSSPICFLIDSGADVNIVGGQDWEHLKREFDSGKAKLKMVELPKGGIHAYGSKDSMVVECSFQAKITVTAATKPSVTATFHVIRKGNRSLLGRSTASDLRLLQVGTAVNNCEALSDEGEFPKMPGVTVKFSVNKAIAPVRNAYYNVPAAYREAARQRLSEMEKRGIIEKVTAAPNWISGMSAVPKGKTDFRLVVNMRAPNRAINREYFRLPLIEEMKVKLHGARCFSKLDLSNAFHHLELSKESRNLTTFLTEEGMYRFTRLMFGVNCAPEVFQREMTRILKDAGNVIVYIDDVLIFAQTLEELRRSVAKVLNILRENNLTLNTAKCEFDQTRIKFLGHELDADGFHIDEDKISSVRNFREPATLSELRSFLGLASFVSPYLKNFANNSSPLWAATTSKTWTWGQKEKEAFNLIKQQIVENTIALGYFSEKDRTVLYTDASPVALGAVLVQESDGHAPRIISFASKALTATERKYAQNQREALGAVWAVEHFSFFLLGRSFTLRTDAQGVAFILNRNREESKRALTRADGWALRLSPYNYAVEYVRGRDNIADSSSRLYCGDDAPFDEDSSPWQVACLEANCVEFLTEHDIRIATAADDKLQKVLNALDTGKWSTDLRRYKAVENDLSIHDGILIKTGCAVIPKSLRTKALQVAHEGHPAAPKMKNIIRQRVWWPEISKDVQKWVEGCRTCAINGKPEKPTPMERIFMPKTVWETIALDFNGPYAKFGGISILVIVDYRSRYIFAKPVKSTNYESVRKVLDGVFEREGYPKCIKTDNGPPFSSEDYKTFCRKRGIHTVYSTPLFPQQNGLVESCMKVVNKAMVAASSDNTNFTEELRQAVNAHNAASHSVTKVPPEEHAKASFDEDLLEKTDRESKLSGKRREDARRGARKCKVKPGDTVIVERHTRAKGDSRFAPKRYTVIQERNGSLTLNDDDGQQQTSRHHSISANPNETASDNEHGYDADIEGTRGYTNSTGKEGSISSERLC